MTVNYQIVGSLRKWQTKSAQHWRAGLKSRYITEWLMKMLHAPQSEPLALDGYGPCFGGAHKVVWIKSAPIVQCNFSAMSSQRDRTNHENAHLAAPNSAIR